MNLLKMDFRYNTQREFTKDIKHNNKIYRLRSLYDTDASFDFDRYIRRYRKKHRLYKSDKIDFDSEIQTIQLYDRLNDLYDTDLFD